MKNKEKKNKFLYYLFLGALVSKLLTFIFKKDEKIVTKDNLSNKPECNNSDDDHGLKEFLEKEEKEIEKFIFGKESFKEFFNHTSTFFKDLFIPHDNNDHKPKILRRKSLISIIFCLLTIKIFLGAYLFLAFPEGAFMSESLAGRVVELVNKDRVKNGLDPLSRNIELNRAASAKAEDMIQNNYFDHYSPDGKKPWEWIHRTDYDYIYAGENLAMNFTTAESVHAALMNSESHKKNILSDRYLDVGVAMISGEIDGKQTNILVQTFGHKRKILQPPTNIVKDVIDDTKKDEVIAVTLIDSVKTISEKAVLGTTTTKIDDNIKSEIKDNDTNTSNSTSLNSDNAESTESFPNDSITNDDLSASSTASSSLAIEDQKETIRKVSMIVRDVNTENTEVMAEKNYLELDNSSLVTIRATPGIVGNDSISTHRKMKMIHYAFMIIVGVIGMLLAVNIFVRIKVQHKSVIVESIFTIVFIVALIYFKFHYLENDLADILLM